MSTPPEQQVIDLGPDRYVTIDDDDVVTDDNAPVQKEFFFLDLMSYAIKDDIASMEAPIYSLSTKPDFTPWRWVSSDGTKSVEVTPSLYGRATLFDKDLLIYFTSQMMAAVNAGTPPCRTVRFVARDFFMATNRNCRDDDYKRLKDSLQRLNGTQITTNIITGKRKQARGFTLISSWGVIEKSPDNSRMIAVEVELSKWLFNAISSKEVLTVNRDYFRLRKPLERRLYQIARKHVGRQSVWEISIDALREKCGSTTARRRKFEEQIKSAIKANNIPDYRLSIVGDTVRFANRP